MLEVTATAILHEDDTLDRLADLGREAIGFHHAGLPRAIRAALEAAFRAGHLKVIASTPTLAAGVNLPAGLVIVRDVHRTEFPRGRPRLVLLPSGEILNMLGRTGRPHQVARGRGIAFVDEKLRIEREVIDKLRADIECGRGAAVQSQLPNSFDAVMRFVLGVIVEWGEARLEDIARVARCTFWHHSEPVEIRFDRPLQEDLMEDIPSYARVDSSICVGHAEAVSDGIEGLVNSGENTYFFRLTLAGTECQCPAASQWRRKEVCKHVACAIHEILFLRRFGDEVRSRCLYACAHLFGPTLDIGTRLACAVDVLVSWGLAERAGAGWRATPAGAVAAATGLDLLLVRQAERRVATASHEVTFRDVGLWAVEDFFGDPKKRERWLRAVAAWLDEVDIKEFSLPEKYRGDFENGLDDLARVAVLYEEIARALGRPAIAEAAHQARGCLAYGVKPDILPLAALRFPQLGRARCRFLYDDRGIRSLDDLATAQPAQLAGRTVPIAMASGWVERARAIRHEREVRLPAHEAEGPDLFDELVSRFRLDPAAFEAPAAA
jgi:helicase